MGYHVLRVTFVPEIRHGKTLARMIFLKGGKEGLGYRRVLGAMRLLF